MRIGRRSLLFGVHQFAYHPWKVFWAWVWLFGWPTWGEFLAIVVHDWGYWWCHDMDGEQGNGHAAYAGDTFLNSKTVRRWLGFDEQYRVAKEIYYHSRFYAKLCQHAPSRLCYADKLGTANYPVWLWACLACLTGEGREYMMTPKHELDSEDSAVGLMPLFRRYRRLALKIIGDDLCDLKRSA